MRSPGGIPDDPVAAAAFSDVLITAMIIVPCALVFFASARGILHRQQGRPLQIFPGTPATTLEAAALEWICVAACGFGVICGVLRVIH